MGSNNTLGWVVPVIRLPVIIQSTCHIPQGSWQGLGPLVAQLRAAEPTVGLGVITHALAWLDERKQRTFLGLKETCRFSLPALPKIESASKKKIPTCRHLPLGGFPKPAVVGPASAAKSFHDSSAVCGGEYCTK